MADISKQWQRYQDALEDEFAFAASQALNDAAFALKDDLGDHVDASSHLGATPFTKRAFMVAKKATKRDLETDVIAKDKQAAYLIPAIHGGTRKRGDYATSKRAGVLVPGREHEPTERNRGNYGNQTLRKQARKKDVFWGRVFAQGEWQYGLWRRKKPKGRRPKGQWKWTALSAIALFREKVDYRKPLELDIQAVAEVVNERVTKASLERAMLELSRYGRVQSSAQRKRKLQGKG